MDTPCIDNIFNSEDAILLAAMCFQAYLIFQDGTLVLPKGYELRHTVCAFAGVEDPTAEKFGFIAESQDTIVIAFRGTDSYQDNESDQDIFQVPYPFVKNSGKTHRGFTCIYQSTRDKLIRELMKLSTTKRLLITGHSLGGSLAVISALDIAVNTEFRNPIVYTYGCSRVGDPDFVEEFDDVVKNSINVFNVYDIIHYMPDKAYPPPFTEEGIYYKHVETSYPVSFQLNSIARNHSISCYFKNLSEDNPESASALCCETPGFCPDAGLCIPFEGICGENKSNSDTDNN